MPEITIKAFSVKNYRTVTQADLDFSHGAVGLIGVNASGKTNVGRAFLFFCHLLKSSLPQIQGPGSVDTQLDQAEWQPLKQLDPTSLLAHPVAGQKITLKAEFAIPSFFVPKNKGHIMKKLDATQTTHDISITAIIQARNLATGELRLVPSFRITIAGKKITRADVQQLGGLWQQIAGVRLQALRPAQEFLTAMNQLSNKSVAGHNAFDQLNNSVTGLEPNFARVSFINNNPMAIEGDISDLSVDNMSTGNLRALQLLSATKNPDLDTAVLIHIEEPETHFHPTLQREIVRSILDACRDKNMALIIETHSPQVLRELYAADVPVYRVEVVRRDQSSGVRQSKVAPLPRGAAATKLLSSMGVDSGFALLGGVVLVTDGVTDPPAYREFFAKFSEMDDMLLCFVPIGCLASKGLDLKDLGRLAEHVLLLADGHFRERHGPRLKRKCSEAGIDFIQLDHWAVENFFTLAAFHAAKDDIPGLTIDETVTLEPMTPIKNTKGISEFSKTHHMATVAKHVSRQDLEQQTDFMKVVKRLKKLK